MFFKEERHVNNIRGVIQMKNQMIYHIKILTQMRSQQVRKYYVNEIIISSRACILSIFL